MLRFAEHLDLQGYELRTRQGYYRVMRLIGEHHGCDPEKLDEEAVRRYFVHVKCEKGWAPKTIRQFCAGAKLFYRGMLKREFPMLEDIRARDREHLPVVLDPDEIRRIFGCFRFRRYRTPLLLCYASGLRVNECVHVTVDDVKGSANKLFIRNSKGKDHYTILGTPVYRELREYWRMHRNPKWLFPEVNRGRSSSGEVLRRMGVATEPMGKNGLRHALLAAVRKAAVTKKATCHTLRHSFATHLIEAGVPITQVQEYLGHAHVETTTIYTHLTPVCHEKAVDCIDGVMEKIL